VVVLSTAGRRTLARLDERIDAAQDALLAPLSDVERDELVRLLRKLLGSP
jgi:DNA-binding MarR family transcriptional regulator